MKLYRMPVYLKDFITGKRKLRLSFDYENNNVVDNIITDFFQHEKKDIQIVNNKIYKHLVAIDGIAGSAGSSAIGDFLAEFSLCTSIGGVDMRENPERGVSNSFELDFFRDGHGVYDLEKITYGEDDRVLSCAVSDFIKLSMSNYKSGIYLYDDNYLFFTKKFIDKILDFYVIDSNGNYIFFPKELTKVQYRNLAKEYLLSFLNNIPSNDYLVLDNLCSITTPDNDIISDYFGDYKIIASYRDPRDIYTTGRLLSGNDWIPKDPEKFVVWYRWYYNKFTKKNNPNLLLIRFEDFVYDYANVSKKITNFIGLDESMHNKKNIYFNPEESCKNVGIYKTYIDQSAIKVIEKGLLDLLWKEKIL